MQRIVLVEDDPSIAQPLQKALARGGFDIIHTDSGITAVELVSGGGVDLVLLDLTLPDIDGLDVCRRIRANDQSLPIIMLTARSEEVDLVVGFDAGADDYLAKPFSMAELMARINARLRQTAPQAIIEVHGIRLDPAAHQAWRDDVELQLTPTEFELLALLIKEPGRVVTRRTIMHDVWNDTSSSATRALDVHISALRRKLGDSPSSPSFITTVRGVGFRFEAPTP